MKVILKRPGEAARIGFFIVEDSADIFCEGPSDYIPFFTPSGNKYVVVCNARLPSSAPFNIFLGGVYYFGNIFICGFDSDTYDYVSLTDDDIEEIASLLDWSDLDIVSLLAP